MKKNYPIDINCDMGESYGRFKVGNDDLLFPYITSCNIACGFHGGDPLIIERTIKNALAHQVRIGAHPSYPDLVGFGRRKMQIPSDELRAMVKYQVAALKSLTESFGGRLEYVKPHGALYNTAASSEKETLAIIQAIREIDDNLALMGLAGSVMQRVANEQNMPFIAEAFADRKYMADGKLRSRSLEGAVIHDAEVAAQQVLSIVKKQEVESYEGVAISVKADSVCIHGDNVGAVGILKQLRQLF